MPSGLSEFHTRYIAGGRGEAPAGLSSAIDTLGLPLSDRNGALGVLATRREVREHVDDDEVGDHSRRLLAQRALTCRRQRALGDVAIGRALGIRGPNGVGVIGQEEVRQVALCGFHPRVEVLRFHHKGREGLARLRRLRELEGQDEKRDKADFALWKAAAPEHIMRWTSPWGEGYPGWHIECSAMATKYLGSRFDIHGGGMDLLFPHHESEIAQSTICNHEAPVNYWMHNNMITIEGRKMGKSYNNVIKLTELFSGNHHLLTQAFHPMTVRFFILQSHYRSTLDFSSEALAASEKALKRLWEAYEVLKALQPSTVTSIHNGSNSVNSIILQLLDQLEDFMDDDFSTAKVIANFFELAPIINSLKSGSINMAEISAETLQLMKEKFKHYLEDVLGLKAVSEADDEMFNGVMQLLIEIRKEAKSKKDFVTSDTIRNKLASLGIALKDEKDGEMSWTTGV